MGKWKPHRNWTGWSSAATWREAKSQFPWGEEGLFPTWTPGPERLLPTPQRPSRSQLLSPPGKAPGRRWTRRNQTSPSFSLVKAADTEATMTQRAVTWGPPAGVGAGGGKRRPQLPGVGSAGPLDSAGRQGILSSSAGVHKVTNGSGRHPWAPSSGLSRPHNASRVVRKAAS